MKFTNRLASHHSNWKVWYALLGMAALLLGSQIVLVTQLIDFFGLSTSLKTTLNAWATPLQFIAFALLAWLFVGVAARRLPTVEDLGLTRNISWRDLGLIVAVFVVTHVGFQLLFLGTEAGSVAAQRQQAVQYFAELGFQNGTSYAAAMVISSVILAPVCEEFLYRGIILRSVHDGLVRKMPLVAVVIAVVVSAVLFALPHLGDSLVGRMAVAYVVSGVAFSLVYVWTGSLTAAMVSHSLQSCFSFASVLLYGRGDTVVSPVIYVLVFGCPVWTYLCARLLWRILPKARTV